MGKTLWGSMMQQHTCLQAETCKQFIIMAVANSFENNAECNMFSKCILVEKLSFTKNMGDNNYSQTGKIVNTRNISGMLIALQEKSQSGVRKLNCKQEP